MARFDAAAAVEALDYDFSAYGGSVGVIPEPTTGAVNGFFRDMRDLLKEVSTLQASLEGINTDDDEALAEAASKVNEASEGAQQYQAKVIEAIAVLCGGVRQDDGSVTGGSPSVEDLNRLPYRVLQAFTPWLMEQIRPKKEASGSKR